MKAPLSWLKEYVDIDCSAEELEAKLFSCGFEVEETIHVGKQIDKIVTCRILSIEKHPNADKLSVTQVDAGKYGKLQIVTAATNIFVGALVPVALDGSTLANGGKINTGALRGVTSYGMFCSGEELGINDDWYDGASVHGILILKEDYPLGEEVKKLLEIEDVIFDINVTANRPDCQSILGLAREVAAVLGKPLKMPNLTYKTSASSTKETIKVSNNATDLCPRYMAQYVSDIKIAPSPLWLKRRLFSMGLRSINNIVDITNYVLLEIGQPMHAFDREELGGDEIVIRRANCGDKIVTLDEKDFNLSSDNLVICDANKPVALAGVMGGLNSGIKDTTKEIVFEAAVFARDNVRKTSKSLGQRTDSSSRFEKGVDLYSPEIGLNRALNLIDTLNCGTISADRYDILETELTEKVIKTTISKINGVLGIEVPTEKIVTILTSLNFGVKVCGDEIEVTVPLYREDMESYPDIAEEIIREYGYDYITPTLLKTSAITNGGKTPEQVKIDSIKNLLVGYGFNEIITYSFVSEKEYELFGLNAENLIKIINPLGEDMSVMRTSLFPSIIRTVAYNLNRKNNSGRLFELAKVYTSNEVPLKTFATENSVLSFALFGENEDFFTAKGVVEGIIANFCAGKKVSFERSEVSSLHPTRSADVFVDSVKVGYFGQLYPVLADKLDIDKPVFGGEIFYDVLCGLFEDKIVFKPISKFPNIERDLALLVCEDVTCAQIVDVIKEAGGEFLTDVSLFDVYQGNQVEKGKKSMAFNLNFISNERTLNVEEVDEIIKNILSALQIKLNAELR